MVNEGRSFCDVILVLMKLTIELSREDDGRWIAEIGELNVLLYGKSKQDAVRRAEAAAVELIADRIGCRTGLLACL